MISSENEHTLMSSSELCAVYPVHIICTVNVRLSLANKVPSDSRSPLEFMKNSVIDSVVIDGGLAE